MENIFLTLPLGKGSACNTSKTTIFFRLYKTFFDNFIELWRSSFWRRSSVVAGLGSFGDYKVVWIGQQKGRNTKENLFRNFGMMRPEGYRKALRVMKLAENLICQLSL